MGAFWLSGLGFEGGGRNPRWSGGFERKSGLSRDQIHGFRRLMSVHPTSSSGPNQDWGQEGSSRDPFWAVGPVLEHEGR